MKCEDKGAKSATYVFKNQTQNIRETRDLNITPWKVSDSCIGHLLSRIHSRHIHELQDKKVIDMVMK